MNESALLVFITLLVTCVFGFLAYAVIWKGRVKQRNILNSDWKEFKVAVANNDIKSIISLSDKLIWNYFIDANQKKIILNELEKRINKHPELTQVWMEAHNRTLGYYPC